MTKKKRNPANKEIMKYLFDNYELKTALDVQEALKDMFSGTIETMLKAELDDHLGYDKSADNEAETANRRNGYSGKKIHRLLGESEIIVPRDREGSFEPLIVPKHQKDVSGIYGKGTGYPLRTYLLTQVILGKSSIQQTPSRAFTTSSERSQAVKVPFQMSKHSSSWCT